MSLLSPTTNTPPSAAAQAAVDVKATPSSICSSIIFKWTAGWDRIWESPDPSAVLAELGTDAAEIFQLNDEIITFMASTLAGRRQAELDVLLAKVAAKPATTTHPDGTVTIDPV